MRLISTGVLDGCEFVLCEDTTTEQMRTIATAVLVDREQKITDSNQRSANKAAWANAYAAIGAFIIAIISLVFSLISLVRSRKGA